MALLGLMHFLPFSLAPRWARHERWAGNFGRQRRQLLQPSAALAGVTVLIQVGLVVVYRLLADRARGFMTTSGAELGWSADHAAAVSARLLGGAGLILLGCALWEAAAIWDEARVTSFSGSDGTR